MRHNLINICQRSRTPLTVPSHSGRNINFAENKWRPAQASRLAQLAGARKLELTVLSYIVRGIWAYTQFLKKKIIFCSNTRATEALVFKFTLLLTVWRPWTPYYVKRTYYVKSLGKLWKVSFVLKERILLRNDKNNVLLSNFIPEQYSIFKNQAEKENWDCKEINSILKKVIYLRKESFVFE